MDNIQELFEEAKENQVRWELRAKQEAQAMMRFIKEAQEASRIEDIQSALENIALRKQDADRYLLRAKEEQGKAEAFQIILRKA